MRKGTAAGVLGVALALPLLPLTAAGAADEPGSGFASVSLHAVARGQEFLFSSTTQIPAQLSVPYAESSIRLGEGSSRATVGWPGDTGATLGTTLVVLGAPEPFTALDDPAVAYARSGGDQAADNTSVPGAVMRATATTTKATALGSVQGDEALSTTAGATTSQAAVELTGVTSAKGTASTTVRDVTVGPLHLSSVTSSATATTDGAQTTASGATSVAGASVAGVPVTIDENGVSVNGTAVVPPGAADAVTSALAQAQLTVVLTKPVKEAAGGRVAYSTGGLVVITPLGTLTLGGAQLTLAATRDDPTVVVDPSLPPVPTDVPTGTAPLPGIDPPTAVPPGGTTGLPPETAGQQPLLPPTEGGLRGLVPVSVRTGYGWAWVASGLLLSFLAASGLLAVSRRWLAPDLSGCPLEGRLP